MSEEHVTCPITIPDPVDVYTEPISDRRPGRTKLVYDKTRRTIIAVAAIDKEGQMNMDIIDANEPDFQTEIADLRTKVERLRSTLRIAREAMLSALFPAGDTPAETEEFLRAALAEIDKEG